ncbi:MAG: flagellar basal-body MS-ring/collar protein FliF [Thermoleophilaceae bacterium]
MTGARSLLVNVTPRGRIVLVACAVGILLLAFFMFRMATAPSYSTIVSGVDPADTGKMTAALDEQGIGYELQNNGTALAVEKAQVPKARIALAETGLTGGDKPGFELFDDQKLGASDFQQQVTYQRALEGEVARTVGQVDGVAAAQVQLTLPEDQLFSEEAKPATAAVLLQAGGGALDPAAVRGIARLVSSSVEGLKPSNVTITDQSGQLLWPTGDGEGSMSAGTKQAAEARVERELEGSLNALLLRTLGPNKGQVQVQADVNANEATEDRLEYEDEGTPLKQRTETEQLEGGGAGGGGAAGAEGNIPTFAQGGGGASNYDRESEETDFGVDKTVTRTRIAPGSVEGLDVALVLDKTVPPADVTALEEAVAGAAGVDEERGDTLTVSQIEFAAIPKPEETGGPIGAALDPAKYAALGLGTLIFLVLVARHLRRREDDEIGASPVWLRELETPTTLAELERSEPAYSGRTVPAPNRLHDDIEGMAERDPDRVAQQVRAWMNEA